MLISQIIPFMFVTAKHTSEQWGLKGQFVQKVRFEVVDLIA